MTHDPDDKEENSDDDARINERYGRSPSDPRSRVAV